MRVVLANTCDSGGAARAVYRLHQGLRNAGVDSQMVVKYNFRKDPLLVGMEGILAKIAWNLDLRLDLDKYPLRAYPHRNTEPWSSQWLPNDTAYRLRRLKPDIMHLHWIGGGFLPIRAFSGLGRPLVWTMHDMWGVTGGCHYDRECGRWQKGCGLCPQLNSGEENDWSRKTWRAKERAWKDLPMQIVCPSRWLAGVVSSSPLFLNKPVHVIPYGLDISIFHPSSKAEARLALGLPDGRSIIVLGAESILMDKRKGFQYLEPALKRLSEGSWRERIAIAVFGADAPEKALDLGFPVYFLGQIRDDHRLALVYSAGDVYLAPSTQDNLPNTVMESIACGTPCVAFNIGGMPDMIEHQVNGFLAKPFEIEDLVKGIEWVLSDKVRHNALCIEARKGAVERFSLETPANKYKALYERILDPEC